MVHCVQRIGQPTVAITGRRAGLGNLFLAVFTDPSNNGGRIG